jgi:hypothetical protein
VRPAATSAWAATCPPKALHAPRLVAAAVDVGVDLLEVEEREQLVEAVAHGRTG